MDTLGLIGFGRFGQFILPYLTPHFNIKIHDIHEHHSAVNAAFVDLKEIASCNKIVLAVPLSELQDTCTKLAKYVAPGTLITDVTSVKSIPMEMMLNTFPDTVDIVGLHPLFGPDSARNGIHGLTTVLCDGRGDMSNEVERFLNKSLGLNVHRMTADEHDRQMGIVQGLTHIMARAIRAIQRPNEKLWTLSFKHLIAVSDVLRDDTDALFLTIQRGNPYTTIARKSLLTELKHLEDWIESGNSESYK